MVLLLVFVLQLLMVPTPFLIGVCDSFMKKVHDYQVAETWVVSLDSKQVRVRGGGAGHPVRSSSCVIPSTAGKRERMGS